MTDDEYNQEFNRLNPQIPLNVRWDANGQRKYYEQLLRDMRSRGGNQYKDPNDNKVPSVTKPDVVVPITPVVVQQDIDLKALLISAEAQVSLIKELIAKQVQ